MGPGELSIPEVLTMVDPSGVVSVFFGRAMILRIIDSKIATLVPEIRVINNRFVGRLFLIFHPGRLARIRFVF